MEGTCKTQSNVAIEIEAGRGKISELTEVIDSLTDRLNPVMITSAKVENVKEPQPDKQRCDTDRQINANNNLLSIQIGRVRTIMEDLQI